MFFKYIYIYREREIYLGPIQTYRRILVAAVSESVIHIKPFITFKHFKGYQVKHYQWKRHVCHSMIKHGCQLNNIYISKLWD